MKVKLENIVINTEDLLWGRSEKNGFELVFKDNVRAVIPEAEGKRLVAIARASSSDDLLASETMVVNADGILWIRKIDNKGQELFEVIFSKNIRVTATVEEGQALMDSYSVRLNATSSPPPSKPRNRPPPEKP